MDVLTLLPHRLDLVPINRSVGLKAKPTKPVTEVLRPVVAKYGLHLSELVARLVSDVGACGESPELANGCLSAGPVPETPPVVLWRHQVHEQLRRPQLRPMLAGREVSPPSPLSHPVEGSAAFF